jgi:hypothetical protein
MRDREIPAVRIAEVLAEVASFGRDTKARLRWLLNFVEQDLSPPGAAERAALATAIFIFSARVASPNVHAGAGMSKLDAGMFDTFPLRKTRPGVSDLQRAAREVLRSLATGVECRCQFEIVGWERLPDRRLLPVVGGDWRSRFLGAVAMLLVEAGPDLAVCAMEGCNRLFLRSRRQAYCSARCSQRQRTQRFRAAHPEEVRETRHQAYARHRRREPGKQKVKIGRLASRSRRARS